ncbi:hypothetical protein L3Q82_009226, partial [Scortum barcoo]
MHREEPVGLEALTGSAPSEIPSPPMGSFPNPASLAPESPSVPAPEEPMQVGGAHLSPEERNRRLRAGATIFTKLDLHNAYHLVRIRDRDEWKTAFNTPLGHFEYLMMPDLSDHQLHVRQVLQRLLENRLFVKKEKCEFHASQVNFLGFILKKGCVQADPEKLLECRSSHIITFVLRGGRPERLFPSFKVKPSTAVSRLIAVELFRAIFSLCGMGSVIKIAALTNESRVCANRRLPPTSRSPRHLLIPPVCEGVA